MQKYKTLNEVQEANLSPAVITIVLWCVRSLIDAYGSDYDADDVGGVVLLDHETTDDEALELFERTWCEGLYEGVTYDEPSRCYLTCVLFNNEEGVSIVVPDDQYLDSVFRGCLKRTGFEPFTENTEPEKVTVLEYG